MARRRQTRRNPRGSDDLLTLGLLGVGGFLAYRWRQSRQVTTTPGEDTNFLSGDIRGINTSPASGVTSYTSHPSGHGQQYV